ncbi:hypothetical protein ABBQ38_009572 [Trebouxia sp. C0009 RCD-2024]
MSPAPPSMSPRQFLESLGCGKVQHDTGCLFLEHLSGVQEVLRSWDEPEYVCNTGLFHSVYGTELFQDYSVSFDRRPDIQALIGDQAEFLVHTFCVMDLASLDATMDAPSGKHHVMARKQHGGHPIPLTDQQYRDLITVQLADWLEQVERYSHMPDPKLGWQPGDAWGHRRNGYRRMAERLGGVQLEAWRKTYAREPASTRHIVNDVTPEVKHYIAPVVAH